LKLTAAAFMIVDTPPQVQRVQQVRRKGQIMPLARRKTRQFFRYLLQSGAVAFAL
jgi:hypothetical protein